MTNAAHRHSALVTGASRGIGAAVVEALALRGYALTISARDSDALAQKAAQLKTIGAPDVQIVPGDQADGSMPKRLVCKHAETFGALSCLVVNAGIGTAGPLAEASDSRLEKMVAVNMRAPIQLIRDALPLLRAGADRDPVHGARIIVLSSLTGVYAEPGLAIYGATKAALLSLVSTLNAEESGAGITATAVAPGYVDTDMSSWVADRIPPDTMIPTSDVAVLVSALLDLSRRSVIPSVLMSRAGTSGYVA